MSYVYNWAPNPDTRSRQYPARALLAGADPRPYTLHNTGPVLDQRDDGACVGYAFAAAGAPAFATVTHSERIYAIAKTLDTMPGEAYTGTSVLAGAKAAEALGLISAYRWAFGLADLVDAICSLGPVVLGLYWTEGMRAAPGGILSLAGAPIGGHCTLATGYSPAHEDFGGRPAIQIKNSWGEGWGVAGYGWIAATDMITLLQRRGEACVVTKA